MSAAVAPLMHQVLKETLECLRWHFHPEWRDRTPFDVFTRLLAKSLRSSGWTESDHINMLPYRIRSYREIRTTAELAQLERGHTQDTPQYKHGPIIIAVYEGQERLIDGASRINLWVRQQNKDLHVVHVHVIED
jgi:hypothetical protein